MEKSKKILIFTTAFRPMTGGSEIALEEICRRLNDHAFDIITPRYKKSFAKTENLANICIHRIGFGMKLDKYIFPLAGFFKGFLLTRTNDYAAIHAYQASYGAGAATFLKYFSSIKFILTLQEGKAMTEQNPVIRFFRKIIIKKADIITAISIYLKNFAEKINKKAEIIVVPNGVDYEKFSSALPIEKTSLDINNTAKLILTVSRLVQKNGLATLFRAIKIVKTLTSDIKLVVVGSGPLESGLKNLALELDISNNVLFMGEKNYSEIPRYLKTADLFVRSSRSEGLGNAFIEAMAAGLPIIGTPVGGIPDFLKDGETGLFCEVDNPKNLAEKIMLLLNNGELREKLIKNGLELVREKYDWNNIIKKFREIYETTNANYRNNE
ncbi:MAG: hypothetical protein A2606_02720 [Candidatus Yanofskybacteria bacterium RIFOXYD1_FULL_42_10]|uniref:Glycosyl transferase family 1 domain-containing protein n=2 Tax=Parcubacteria group TaxID=1794811 RepID=A0A1F8HX51_9BACT|nr:MAG: Glycosyl transferase group 1 [Candidatus Jorgensenbacteria bacterium GW2011_GWF2_41_8]OGN41709.1 MAG: hypothetical protein A2606_02720 [Candidatus Yanofskybacteria bacterium RIFOXYD1_FULL_42_10]